MLSSGPGTGLVGSGSSPDRWGWDMDYRVRPLPPREPLAFVCVWPERGIPPSRVAIDGADDPGCGRHRGDLVGQRPILLRRLTPVRRSDWPLVDGIPIQSNELAKIACALTQLPERESERITWREENR